jgi:tetratricopeptide (TPR) repeat protein
VARVPVSPENIKRANETAKEGDLSFARGNYYAALIKYLEAGRLNPNSEFISNKLGITYSKLEFYTEAEAAFMRCIGLNRRYAYPHNNLGSVYFALDEKKKAERQFKRAIGLKKDVASFHMNLGTLYFEKGKFDDAMEEWRNGLRIDPSIMDRSTAISLVASGNQEFAMEKRYSMARLYASMGAVDLALENLQEALNAGFTDLQAILNESDFDPIREEEKFVAFIKTARLLLQP